MPQLITRSCPPGDTSARRCRSFGRPAAGAPAPNLPQVYRAQVERLHEAFADPGLRDEALGILRGPIQRTVVHPGDDGPHVRAGWRVGEIVGMGELGLDAKQAARSLRGRPVR